LTTVIVECVRLLTKMQDFYTKSLGQKNVPYSHHSNGASSCLGVSGRHGLLSPGRGLGVLSHLLDLDLLIYNSTFLIWLLGQRTIQPQ